MTTYYAAQFGITLSIVNIKVEATENNNSKPVSSASSSKSSSSLSSPLRTENQINEDTLITATIPPEQIMTELRQRCK